MSGKRKKSVNIMRYKSKREMNIGILIFFVIFIYLLITILTYATDKRISVYEVRKGSIVKDNSYTGLVLREEKVINAEESGYVSYFQDENSKVKKGGNIYALSAKALNTEQTAEDVSDVKINEDIVESVVLKVQNANQSYNAQKFSNVYSVKNEITAALQSASNVSKTTKLDAAIASQNSGVKVYKSVSDGMISLSLDGYETLTEKEIDKDSFDYSQYAVKQLNDQMQVEVGDPVYKLITDENWKVYIQLSKEAADELKDLTSIKTKIDKDNETIWAEFSILEKDGEYYGCLGYDNSMIRYAKERYLNVELILQDQNGLKIPKSSVVEKEFFVVPQDYLTTSGASDGFLVQKDGKAVFYSADIYDANEEGYLYVNPKDFKENMILIKPESADTYILKEKQILKGVYNINKGYAVFRKIDILCENDEYYIVEEGTLYGLSNYDHIVQDGDQVKEDEVVFQ